MFNPYLGGAAFLGAARGGGAAGAGPAAAPGVFLSYRATISFVMSSFTKVQFLPSTEVDFLLFLM